MPKQICTTVYTFDELSDEAKEKAREWFREGMQDDSFFSESVIEDAKEIGKLMGIEIDKVYFSGFWSQGDGACFEGSYAYAKGSVKALTEYAPQDAELHRIVKALAEVQKRNFYGIYGTIKHSGHYYHRFETNITLYKSDNQGREDYLKEEDNDSIVDLLRDFMQWIYKTLEAQYEYENSDEQVDETIRINEYEFTESGSRRITI